MSSALGLPGHKYQQGLTPEQAAARINELKKALNQRLENKSAANEGNSICLRKALRFSDLGATNTLNHEQWVQAFVRLGAQFSEADLDLLFYSFASENEAGELVVAYLPFVEAMTSGVAHGPLVGSDFITVISERHGVTPREGKRTYDDRLFNKPPPYALGESEPNPQPRRIIEKSTNTSSVQGGIFAPAPPIVAPEMPSIKNSSTLSLAHAEWEPSQSEMPAPPVSMKRMSNTSSVPGGIFAEGSADDFRVRGSIFVRPGY